jgi:hypothetical protein
MGRNRMKIEIPSDRECCWNCRFSVFFNGETHLEMCLKKAGRKYAVRTYKCKDFYNKAWPVPRKDVEE